MKILAIYTHKLGPLGDGGIQLENEWTEEVEPQVLFTGANGCGKSTVLRAIAMLWEATGYWLDKRKALPKKHEARVWLQRWGGVAVVVNGIEPFYKQPVGFFFGKHSWVDELQEKHPDVFWIGEAVPGAISNGGTVNLSMRHLYLTECAWLNEWSEHRKKLILSHEKVDGPNIIYLDAEERRWVTPRRNLSEPLPDLLTQRWLTKYVVTDDWKGQLEASLITLKTTQLHKFHEVIRNLNQFLVGKEIDPDIKPGEGRLRVKLKGQRGVFHSIDELSAGEHQILILIYLISRWMQPGGVVLIDEPDLYLHPSLVSSLLSTIEQLVAKKGGQLLITSHAVDVWQRYENQGMRIELKANSEG